MVARILGLRRVFASAVNGKYQPGMLLSSIYQESGGSHVTGGGPVLITPVRSCSYRCDAHMNELPVPCAPWEPWYSDKQSFYNKILVAGIFWFLFSFGMMIYTGSIFLNWGPPRYPSPPMEMVEECEDE